MGSCGNLPAGVAGPGLVNEGGPPNFSAKHKTIHGEWINIHTLLRDVALPSYRTQNRVIPGLFLSLPLARNPTQCQTSLNEGGGPQIRDCLLIFSVPVKKHPPDHSVLINAYEDTQFHIFIYFFHLETMDRFDFFYDFGASLLRFGGFPM